MVNTKLDIHICGPNVPINHSENLQISEVLIDAYDSRNRVPASLWQDTGPLVRALPQLLQPRGVVAAPRRNAGIFLEISVEMAWKRHGTHWKYSRSMTKSWKMNGFYGNVMEYLYAWILIVF
jgi:hypothetical protein